MNTNYEEFCKKYDEALTSFRKGDRVCVSGIGKYDKHQWLNGYCCTVKSVTKKYVRIIPDGYENEVYSISPLVLEKI